MSVVLRIGHGNGHNEPSLIDFVRDTKWDSFGCAEADRLIDKLRALPGSTLYVIGNHGDRWQDTPILVTGNAGRVDWLARRVSRALGKPGSSLNRVAPARILNEVRYPHPLATALGCNGIAHLNLHPVAGPKQLNGRNPLAPLTREYRKAWRAARQTWRRAVAEGYIPVLTTDAQMSARSRRPWSPARQARRLRARTWSTGIDWVFFDARLALHGEPTIHELFDHPGFIARFTARHKETR